MDGLNSEVTELEADIVRLKKRVDELERTRSGTASERDMLRTQLQATRAELAQA